MKVHFLNVYLDRRHQLNLQNRRRIFIMRCLLTILMVNAVWIMSAYGADKDVMQEVITSPDRSLVFPAVVAFYSMRMCELPYISQQVSTMIPIEKTEWQPRLGQSYSRFSYGPPKIEVERRSTFHYSMSYPCLELVGVRDWSQIHLMIEEVGDYFGVPLSIQSID